MSASQTRSNKVLSPIWKTEFSESKVVEQTHMDSGSDEGTNYLSRKSVTGTYVSYSEWSQVGGLGSGTYVLATGL